LSIENTRFHLRQAFALGRYTVALRDVFEGGLEHCEAFFIAIFVLFNNADLPSLVQSAIVKGQIFLKTALSIQELAIERGRSDVVLLGGFHLQISWLVD
jgi:hypothetical protein